MALKQYWARDCATCWKETEPREDPGLCEDAATAAGWLLDPPEGDVCDDCRKGAK